MTQYIDKSAVIAEIERRISVLKANESVISMLAGGMFINEFKDLLSFLNTLEVKDVNPTDAFIEKGCEWLESVNLDYYQIREGVFSRELVDDFRKAMKGE